MQYNMPSNIAWCVAQWTYLVVVTIMAANRKRREIKLDGQHAKVLGTMASEEEATHFLAFHVEHKSTHSTVGGSPE